MKPPYRQAPFTFAEIVVGAPWAASILAPRLDHDEAVLLHRNTISDRRPGAHDESPARRQQPGSLWRAVASLSRRVRASLRPMPARG